MSSELLDAGWPLLEALVVPVAKTEELWDVSSISYTFCTFFGQKKHKDMSDSTKSRKAPQAEALMHERTRAAEGGIQ